MKAEMMRTIHFRKATENDLPTIVSMLADDELGRQREIVGTSLNSKYREAYEAIKRDPNQYLAVVEDSESIVGCLQLTFIPGLSRTGMWRGHIEGVRIAATQRGTGLGKQMFEWAIDECRRHNCGLVQLTSDKTRPEAIRFYESLGFTASHEGMKLAL